MKRIVIVTIAMFAFIVLAFPGFAFARCGICQAEADEGDEIINAVCPVMGGKVDKDTPHIAEYKGKKIGFCCPDCVGQFEADPEKYMAKMRQECVIKCPECGAEIDVMKECKKSGYTCPITKEIQPAEESE